MPSYEYHALDKSGKKQRGFIDADSERQARQNLRDQQLLPNRLVEVKETNSKKRTLFAGKVSIQHLSLFTQQLAALVQSGVAIEDALQATSEQSTHKHLKAALQGVKSKVREGHTIAEGMADYQNIFPPIYRELIRAGEKSGELTQVLLQLADYTERNQRLRNNVMQASIYPIVLTSVAITIISLLMAYVVPKVVEQFDHVGQQLPLLTRVMISVSDFVVNHGASLIAGLIGTIVVCSYFYNKQHIKLRVHKVFLKTPFIKKVVINLETARLLNTLNIMLHSGVPLLDALYTSQQTSGNLHFKSKLQTIAEKVREGGSLNKAMSTADLFPPISIFMVANGELSGELATALKKSAEQQEHQLNSIISIVTKLIEPVLIIVFGLIVLAIVLAILLPIMQLNDLTQF
ncbi:type II secretion system inner membrane protein GspF [Neptuniibacter sp. QD57_21]|uniref:type II secretion system inner membrane protein GspF n=1 Tax=Neptuniibacter sp. QD57_21 TaxID=3398213 RepID=UPI0039F53C0E